MHSVYPVFPHCYLSVIFSFATVLSNFLILNLKFVSCQSCNFFLVSQKVSLLFADFSAPSKDRNVGRKL